MIDENYKENKNNNPSSPAFSSTKFAVFIPTDASKTGVYDSKADALSAIHGQKGARFTLVKGEAEAETFFQNEQLVSQTPSRKVVVADDVCPYSTPSIFGEMMSAINRGDIEKIQSLVDLNPLYLVTKIDTPTILHQGARYNALHLCANKNLPLVAQFIVNLLRNGSLVSRLYPNDLPESRSARIRRILDMYFNSPDKFRSETPLHYASKMGNVEMVWFLSSQPECDTEARNVDGLTPADVNCCRLGSNCDKQKSEIAEALQGHFYLIILRPNSNQLEPLVRPPIRASSPTVNISEMISVEDRNLYRITAFIGPMSKEAANDVYETLTNSSRRRRRLNDSFRNDSMLLTPTTHLRNDANSSLLTPLRNSSFYEGSPCRSTPRKPNPCVANPRYGIENCARRICFASDIPFYECYEFLQYGDGLDVNSREGLEKIELYLKNQHLFACRGCELCSENKKEDVQSEEKLEINNLSESCSDSNSSYSSSTSSGRNSVALAKPIWWIGGLISGISNYIWPTPKPANQTPEKNAEKDKECEVKESEENKQGDLNDSFIQKFASLSIQASPMSTKIGGGGGDSIENTVLAADDTVNSRSRSCSQMHSDDQLQNSYHTSSQPIFFSGTSKPSHVDFHIFQILNGEEGEETGEENFLLSETDFPHLMQWRQRVKYFREHTLSF